MTLISGGCLCEKVRYKVTAPPISQGICYCLQCQKTGGAFGSPMMVSHKHAFECQNGELSFHVTESARGSTVQRCFCKDCGCHIFSRISDVPDIVTVKAATLDDPSEFIPEYLVWTRDVGSSCVFPLDIPQFSENAPLEMILKG